MTTADRVRERLRGVLDPCSVAAGSDLDVVEMGLVKSVAVDGGDVHVDMRLTTPACHMVGYFDEEIRDRVGGLGGVDSVTLETDAGLEWSEGMMSDEARRRRERVLAEHRARYEDGDDAPATRSGGD